MQMCIPRCFRASAPSSSSRCGTSLAAGLRPTPPGARPLTSRPPTLSQTSFWDNATLQLNHRGNTFFNLSQRLDPLEVALHGDAIRYIVLMRDAMNTPWPPLDASTLVAVSPRLGLAHGSGRPGGRTVLLTNTSDMHILDLVVHGAASEAVVEAGGGGGNVYDAIRVDRPQTPQPFLLAANADGFHSSEVR